MIRQWSAVILVVVVASLCGCASPKHTTPTPEGLPSIDALHKQVEEVGEMIDAIDQPVDETCKQRLLRLGLKPEQIGLTPEQVDTAPPSCKS